MRPTNPWPRRAGTLPAALALVALLTIGGCSDAVVGTALDGTSEPTPTAPTPTTPTGPTASIPNAPTGPNAPTTPVPTGNSPLVISGVMTPQYQGIRVSLGGGAVTDAAVTVNGFPLAHCCGDLYVGSLPGEVPAGDTLHLRVVTGGVTFEALGEVGPTPTIVAPAVGSTFAWTDSVGLAWSIPAQPDRFEVCLNCWANSLDGAIYNFPGMAREFQIAPGQLVDYGSGSIVVISAYTSNFLRSTSSPAATTNVLFLAQSREARFTITY